jgi:hypothetical protein
LESGALSDFVSVRDKTTLTRTAFSFAPTAFEFINLVSGFTNSISVFVKPDFACVGIKINLQK